LRFAAQYDYALEVIGRRRKSKGEPRITYRTLLLLVLSVLALVITGVSAALTDSLSNHLLRREVHRKVHSVAVTAALLLDPMSVAQVAVRADEDKPQYAEIKQVLNEVRDVNRRRDIWVDHIFTLVPARGDRRGVSYGVDTGEEPGAVHHAGDVFMIGGAPATEGLQGIHRLDNQLDQFQGGYDMGFAPIFDHSGKLVAELGVKLGWAPDTMLGNVWRFVLPQFVVTMGLALIAAVLLSRQVTGPLYRLRGTVEAIGRGDLNALAEPRGTVEFAQMASAINEMTSGLRIRKMIEQAFAGYLSREVLDRIVREGKLPELKGERRHVTILFADIRDFTSMAEAKRPEEVVEILSEFFARMVAVVLRHRGYIDKFIGDGMMVTFGAPEEDPQQEMHAITAALEMQKELRKLCAQWKARGRGGFRMGIGVNSGYAVVGNIGSETHMEYTAIGDAVNLASRLQSATRNVDAEILVSETTRDAAGPMFRWAPLGQIVVKGRLQPVSVYSVEDDITGGA
jgi:adenylate cyclase